MSNICMFLLCVSSYLISWQPDKRVKLLNVRLPPKQCANKPDFKEDDRVEVFPNIFGKNNYN